MDQIAPPTEHILKTTAFPAVGCCIYCGEAPHDLSNEHIIPFGLAGLLVLPKASCQVCANITKKFEQTCLRTITGPIRIRNKMPTRRPKERPKSLPYAIINASGTLETIDLPAEHLPRALAFLKLDLPTLLARVPPTPNWHGGKELWIWHEPEDLDRIRALYGPKQHFPARFDVTPFVQIIGKIAYSYAVAKLGYRTFKPLVLDVIFGRTNIPSHWIGGAPDAPPVQGVMHQIAIEDDYKLGGRRYIVVDVRLFASLGAPIYRAVIGEF
jgi:hypothetical protein